MLGAQCDSSTYLQIRTCFTVFSVLINGDLARNHCICLPPFIFPVSFTPFLFHPSCQLHSLPLNLTLLKTLPPPPVSEIPVSEEESGRYVTQVTDLDRKRSSRRSCQNLVICRHLLQPLFQPCRYSFLTSLLFPSRHFGGWGKQKSIGRVSLSRNIILRPSDSHPK